MRNRPTAYMDATNDAPATGIIPRRAVWFTAKTRDTGAAVSMGLWDGDEDLPIEVVSGEDGSLVTRGYYAGGGLLAVSDIPNVSDLTVQTVTIDVSQLADATRQLLREYDIRRARVEIHELLLSTETGQFVAPGQIEYVGIVDGAPIKTPGVGRAGQARLKIIPEVIALLDRSNPEKASYEAQLLRQGDEWNLYCATIETWKLPWGQTTT